MHRKFKKTCSNPYNESVSNLELEYEQIAEIVFLIKVQSLCCK